MAKRNSPANAASSPPGLDLMTRRERFAAVLAQFRSGAASIDQALLQLAEQFPLIKWKREEVYQLLRAGLAEGYIVLAPGRDEHLESRLVRDYGLREAAIVPSVYFQDIAERAGRHILGIIDDFARAGKERVGIGFASGFSMSHVAHALARLLLTTGIALPPQLQLHALSVGFNPRFLREDPNFFLAAFDRDAIKVRTDRTEVSFVGLYAPSIIRTSELGEIRKMEGIKQGIEAVEELDIVVTGASDFDDLNSTLADFYYKNENPEIQRETETLLNAKVVGHLLYLPLAAAGPVIKHDFVLPTVLGLEDLHRIATNGSKRVVLVAGLRVKTFEVKKIIGTILRQERRLITDLVTDQRNAQAVG